MKLSEKITTALTRVSSLRDNGMGLQALWNSNFYEWQNEAIELGENFGQCFTTASKTYRYDIRNTEAPANFGDILRFIIALLQVAEKNQPEQQSKQAEVPAHNMKAQDLNQAFDLLRGGNLNDLNIARLTTVWQSATKVKTVKDALKPVTDKLAPALWLMNQSDLASLKLWLAKNQMLLNDVEKVALQALSTGNNKVSLETIMSLDPSDEAWDELMSFFNANPMVEMKMKDGKEKQWKSMLERAKTNKATAFEWFATFFHV